MLTNKFVRCTSRIIIFKFFRHDALGTVRIYSSRNGGRLIFPKNIYNYITFLCICKDESKHIKLKTLSDDKVIQLDD